MSTGRAAGAAAPVKAAGDGDCPEVAVAVAVAAFDAGKRAVGRASKVKRSSGVEYRVSVDTVKSPMGSDALLAIGALL